MDRVLKSMEFAGGMEEGQERNKGRSLEVLLLEKNKALQSENTQLKVSCADLTGKYIFQLVSFIHMGLSSWLTACTAGVSEHCVGHFSD